MLTLDQLHAQLASGELAGARHIRLSDGLTRFPPALYELAGTLESLDLSGNRLTALPDDFTRFSRLRILFGSGNPMHDIRNLIGLYQAGKLKLDELVTNRYSLDEIGQGFQDMLDGKNIRGVVVHEP